MFDAYAARDVIYLMGQNDTCNEYITPHCQSHGLDKSCAAMLEGRFRRERAEDYIKFLAAFFGRPVHTGSLVPVRAASISCRHLRLAGIVCVCATTGHAGACSCCSCLRPFINLTCVVERHHN